MVRSMRLAAGMFSLALVMGFIGRSDAVIAQDNGVPAKSMASFRVCLAAAKPGTDCGQAVYDACQAEHDQPDTTLSMSECTMVTHKAWDRILNERYRALIAASPPDLKLKLQRAQRAWIVSRDADCEAIYEANKEGTIRGPLYAGCMVEKTSERVRWLAQMNEN